jgi:hypothetical protein
MEAHPDSYQEMKYPTEQKFRVGIGRAQLNEHRPDQKVSGLNLTGSLNTDKGFAN